MSDEKKSVPAPSSAVDGEEVELEYRPFVKYTGIGLAVLLVLGSGYATYALGFRQGYESGISSGQVESAINSAAVQSIANLLQAPAADDSELLRMAAHTDKSLSWINDESVRREAEWTLVCALLQRGMAEQANTLFLQILTSAPAESLWSRRACMTAERLLAYGQATEAAETYRKALNIARKCSATAEQVSAMEGLTAVLLNAGARGENVHTELNDLLREASSLGAPALTVRAMILLHEGERLRDMGKAGDAARCFETLLQLLPEQVDKLPSAAVICFGAAAGECGKPEQAEALLNLGLKQPVISLQDTLCHLLALRHLSEMAQARGDHAAAMALLNRAEGLATGRVAAGEAFWNCLFVQKGWLLLLAGNKDAAAEQFNRARHNTPNPATCVQALEGAGRCILDTHAEEASGLFAECTQLRRKHFPDDFEALGRVSLLHAHARDLVNMPEQAAELYAKAAEYLQGETPVIADNRRMALLGRAHALFRAEKWEAALTAWEAVLPLLGDKPELQAEATARMQDCRSRLNLPDPDFTSDISS